MLSDCSIKKVYISNDWVYTACLKQLLLTLSKEITVFCSAFFYLTKARLLTKSLFKYEQLCEVESY